MAEAGSFAEKVKQQADIVRVIGEYVRLKKTGQNFTGLCPFHQEKTPSFSVHPVKQMYYCFGCHEGGDVFKFVMQMDKCEFPEAVRTVAEKCGIPIPRPRERSPEERLENQQRAALVEMHREAAAFFARQLHEAAEGKVATAYLEGDRGLDRETIARFDLGFAPSSGDALLRYLKSKYPEKLLEPSGLFSRDQSGRLYDRFRRRIMFPIANESGKIIAFGGRAMGDDMPKYLNSSETPIYSKSNVLYNLHRAKESVRSVQPAELRYIFLVEGYMDCVLADSAKFPVVASCGTSLTEMHARLLRRFTPRVVVWYDKDSAGKAGTDRSLQVLGAQELEIEVYEDASSTGSDPDTFIREVGRDSARAPVDLRFAHLAYELRIQAEAYAADQELRKIQAPFYEDRLRQEAEIRARHNERKTNVPKPEGKERGSLLSYNDFLTSRAKQLFDVSTTQGKLQAINFLMPHVQQLPNKLLRSEWATRIASELRVDEPVLREALRRAAVERRSEVKPKAELLAPAVKPDERQLMQMLVESEGFREKLAREIISSGLHRGLETEKIFESLVSHAGGRPDPATLAAQLEEKDRRLLFEVLFEQSVERTWEEAESCLDSLRNRRIAEELAGLEKKIQALPPGEEQNQLHHRKLELNRLLSSRQGTNKFSAGV